MKIFKLSRDFPSYSFKFKDYIPLDGMFVGIYLLNDIIEDANHHTMLRQIPADQRAQVTMVTHHVIDQASLFTVVYLLYMGKPVGPQSGQIVRKIQDR